MPPIDARRPPLLLRAPPGDRSVHPALTSRGVDVFLKPPTFALLVLRVYVRVGASVTGAGALTMGG